MYIVVPGSLERNHDLLAIQAIPTTTAIHSYLLIPKIVPCCATLLELID